MTAETTHEELRELLPAVALGMLDASELQRRREHVVTCTDCARELAELQDVTAGLAELVTGSPLDLSRSNAVRARLLARAATRRVRSSTGVLGWAGWAVAASLMGVLLIHHGFHQPLGGAWIVAGALIFVSIGLGAGVLLLRAQNHALRDRLRATPPARPE